MIMTERQCRETIESVVRLARSPKSRGVMVSPDAVQAMKDLGLDFPPDVWAMTEVDDSWLGPLIEVKADVGHLIWTGLV